MDPQDLTITQKQEAFKRELFRKSLDECKVFNPTSENYTVYWDKFPHSVPANGEAILPRYIANKYLKEMTDKKLTNRSDENVKMENERRVKKGMALMDKHTEQPAFESNFAINKPEAREPILRSLWGGVVKAYGMDMPLGGGQEAPATSDQDLLAQIEASTPTTEQLEPSLSSEVTTDDDKE